MRPATRREPKGGCSRPGTVLRSATGAIVSATSCPSRSANFEAQFGHKLMSVLWKTDSLFVVYKEFLTVIAGSLHAIRSSRGFLSSHEYVTGCDSDGVGLPELRDSAVHEQAARKRIYSAFEIYTKLKKQAGKYDRTDPVRHMMQRLRRWSSWLVKQGVDPRKHRNQELRMFSAIFLDEVQDLLPIEILLCRIFCEHTNCWVFAGDTAQTISKGVEFRFESIRRLFFEEFLHWKEWLDEPAPTKETLMCTLCGTSIHDGTTYECHSKFTAHTAHLCGDECVAAFEKRCEDASKGATKGVLAKMEFSRARGRLSCPLCHLVMKESKITAEATDDASQGTPERDQDRHTEFTALDRLPKVHHLTHNHRSMRGIVDLAGSVIDIILHFFEDKIDKLPREVSKVDAKSLPVFIHGCSFNEALDIVFGRQQGVQDGQRILEFGARQAVLVWNELAKSHVRARFPESIVMTIDECKGLEFSDVFIVNPFGDMAGAGTTGGRNAQLWNLVYAYMKHCGILDAADSRRIPDFDPSVHGLLCSWLKHLYVGTVADYAGEAPGLDLRTVGRGLAGAGVLEGADGHTVGVVHERCEFVP
ncbi:unnamed protein product [Prorocentrum cordatum]|uniref:C2H2-type domain-containing protein n=1 Tax=Prorocentrum cordatum TaxID=2364126 RepID=A0ABN9SRB4_9DINO|nr:unnamed protein product [Polarella glacialis]